MEKHLYLRILEYGYKNDTFCLQQLIDDLELKGEDHRNLLKLASSNDDTNRVLQRLAQTVERKKGESLNSLVHILYRLTPNALYQYLEYVELIETRQVAHSSRNLAIWAIVIASIVGLLQITLTFLAK